MSEGFRRLSGGVGYGPLETSQLWHEHMEKMRMEKQDEYTALMLMNLAENLKNGRIRTLERKSIPESDTVCTIMLRFEGIPDNDENLQRAADMILNDELEKGD